MTCEVFISTTPFGDVAPSPLSLLRNRGYTIKQNTFGRKMKAEELLVEAIDATALIAGTENLGPLVASSSALRMISRVGIGLDGVPLAECKGKGIFVSWTPDAVTMAVAELTVGLMLDVTRYVAKTDHLVRQHYWERPLGKRLGESVIGIVGFGRIGFNLARLLGSFRPREVLIHDIEDKSTEVGRLTAGGLNIRAADFYELISSSDIVSLHVPLYAGTKQLINAENLALMPRGSVLINTSRGGVVCEDDLFEAVDSGHLSGAALDVFTQEPYKGRLTNLDNVILTPHLGSCAIDCRANMERQAAEEVARFLDGDPLTQEVPASEYRYQFGLVSV